MTNKLDTEGLFEVYNDSYDAVARGLSFKGAWDTASYYDQTHHDEGNARVRRMA